jgi:hypothetical protein
MEEEKEIAGKIVTFFILFVIAMIATVAVILV